MRETGVGSLCREYAEGLQWVSAWLRGDGERGSLAQISDGHTLQVWYSMKDSAQQFKKEASEDVEW